MHFFIQLLLFGEEADVYLAKPTENGYKVGDYLARIVRRNDYWYSDLAPIEDRAFQKLEECAMAVYMYGRPWPPHG
jgi:hypothetical protein